MAQVKKKRKTSGGKDVLPESVANYVEVLEENRELKRQLAEIQQDLVLASAAAQLSESSLGEIWDDPEDAAYDNL